VDVDVAQRDEILISPMRTVPPSSPLFIDVSAGRLGTLPAMRGKAGADGSGTSAVPSMVLHTSKRNAFAGHELLGASESPVRATKTKPIPLPHCRPELIFRSTRQIDSKTLISTRLSLLI
jgi:hypothetical protein